MSFAHSFALWLAPLIAGPLVLHLISRFWSRKKPFPWVRLLRFATSENKRIRRIKELLLILLRTGFVASLVLAAAGPFTGGVDQPVFVDVSASTVACRSSPHIPGARFFDFAWHKNRPDHMWGPARPELLRGLSGYVVSDFQASNWRGFSDTGLIPVVPPCSQTDNVALLKAFSESPRPGRQSRLRLILHNYSTNQQTRSLVVTDGRKSLFNATVQLTPDRDTALSIGLRLRPGTQGLTISIGPPDPMAFDDTFRIAVVSPGPVDVDVMTDNPFVRAALFPRGLSWSLQQKQGAWVVVVSGAPVPGRAGVAFLRDSVDALSCGLPFGVFENATIDSSGATIKNGVFFKEGEVLLRDLSGRALAVKWGDWVICGFSPDPLNTDLVFKPDFPVLLNQWIDRLALLPICENAFVGQRVDLPSGESYITGPDGFKRLSASFVPETPGFYKQTSGDSLIALVAVNVPSVESSPARLSPQEIEQAFGKPPVQLHQLRRRVSSKRDLVPWFLLAALVFMLLEVLLIRARS